MTPPRSRPRCQDERVNDDVVQLLELLAGGASSERLAHVAVENPRLARASALALRIHSTLSAHRRRETELSALFDTASDLARLRDTDAVLRSIVRRGRTLLGVDVSYLSLNDEAAGRTYMRVTDGSVSALFQKVTLGMGEGLGGLVAQTAQPYATRDYFGDERFRHTLPIDSAVRDEGLTAILGVPLALGDQVIGVLYASDRTRREFTPEEIALLSSLADHAAIALDNAALLEEISEQSAALHRAEEAHDRLMDLVLRGAAVPEVAAAVADVLHGEIGLFDADGVELTNADPVPPVPSASAVAASRASGRAMSTADGWVCAVQAGPELLGSMVLSGRGDLVDADRRLFERAAVVTALLLMLRRSVAKAEDEVRGELLTDLLTAPERNPGALLARAERLGLDLAQPHAVLIAHAERVPRTRLAVAAGRCAALAGIHAEEVVLLVPATDPGPLAARTAETLRSAVDGLVTVGASGPAHGPQEIAAAHAEAARCLRALLALGRIGEGASMDGLGFLGVLLGEQTDLPGFVRRTIGPVLDYDARRGTELLATLQAYFAAGGNLTRAKDVLHVHVNTVVQRLDRIGSLLGADWQTPDRALEIHLALRLHVLQG
ncbi:GAF domain-containing protein [Saccharopolyspora antimicrobica]|uniref:GAF domain-containing protein n=1 Tax=Saccharopolyspora antimicrobica TaxID=455193 RepID=A0A1I4TIH6_9PSEU|nr:GAF domain-containing protein [Saccharopolyspora antimicrobica]RKT85707.1 sugar diacid utilization regulator [Saccharopolyspora antimicrobica]SFM76516.1 GAF domain-containing protein [Saccharopolyspora antimicrobica]